MNTKIIKLDEKNIDDSLISEAANVIKAGGIVAFPTETVYGLGANGLDEEAVKNIYKAKGRPSDNPLILHISSVEELQPLVEEIPELAYDCMERFWPGPLTIIFKKSEIIPNIITAGLDTVAIRMPDHPIASKLIWESKVPIAAPSANLSGKPSPTKGIHVIEDMMDKIEMIIDGGDTGVGLESTVLDLSTETPTILRPGGITLEDLRGIIPNVVQDESITNKNKAPKSPGQKYRHYAPNAEMILYTGDVEKIVEEIIKDSKKFLDEGKKVGIMATEETKDRYSHGEILVSGSRLKRETIAHNLFDTLRSFDEMKVDIILAEGVSFDNIGMAIMNRMVKAASSKVIKL
ncbi:MAG: L-threonylcarbamoyladenylate synthase [Tissierellaceae bacterium]|nr:L-threonylcarbamoyladenylate synthase [Tissierellaceae bacterium]